MIRSLKIAIVIGILGTGVPSTDAQADICRSGFTITVGFLGAITGLAVDVLAFGGTGGTGTVIGTKGGSVVGLGLSTVFCGEEVDIRQVEERTLRGVIDRCISENWAYSNPIPFADDHDFCTVPINPFVHGNDEMGTISGRQLDVIDVVRQFKSAFQLVSKQIDSKRFMWKRTELKNKKLDETKQFVENFADELDDCIRSYIDKWGASRSGATDFCYVTPSKLTSSVWKRESGRKTSVSSRNVLKTIRRALPEGV